MIGPSSRKMYIMGTDEFGAVCDRADMTVSYLLAMMSNQMLMPAPASLRPQLALAGIEFDSPPEVGLILIRDPQEMADGALEALDNPDCDLSERAHAARLAYYNDILSSYGSFDVTPDLTYPAGISVSRRPMNLNLDGDSDD